MAFKINPPATGATGTTTGTGTIIQPASNNGPRPSTGPKPAFTPRSPRPFPPRDRNFGNRDDKDGVRLNERIRVPQVRLIDEKGEQVGIVETRAALQMARDRGLDLMEVSPNAQPPVCKICDYGKHKYEKKKKEHQARKNQVVVKVKEVQLRPNTDQHDLDYKIKNSREFLEEGDKVKFTILFRGREIAHTEPGFKLVAEVIERLKDVGIVEAPAKLEGKKLIMIMAPNPAAKKK
ncbi:MAG: translation initiation factor IF-3 [Bdellovibrionales bacterium]|nr:translation initiation factor IF-3 [Bdellovibrionales bacterium]